MTHPDGTSSDSPLDPQLVACQRATEPEWHCCEVLQDSGRLMKDLDNILKSSFARCGG